MYPQPRTAGSLPAMGVSTVLRIAIYVLRVLRKKQASGGIKVFATPTTHYGAYAPNETVFLDPRSSYEAQGMLNLFSKLNEASRIQDFSLGQNIRSIY